MLLEKDLRLRQKAVQCSSFSSASSASTWASSSPVVGFRPRTPELCDEIDCRRGALRALRRSSARSVFYAAGSARRKKKDCGGVRAASWCTCDPDPLTVGADLRPTL